MSWTDERVEQLKKLWAEGLSASQIAAQLGGVSRNAVIGKVHRLHLPGRAKSGGSRSPRAKRPTVATQRTGFTASRTTSAAARPAPTRTGGGGGGGAAATVMKADVDAIAIEELDTRPIEDVVVPISKQLKLIELTEATCKWPIGDPMVDGFHFCGNDCDEASPYCTYHSKLAYQPTSERRRAR